MVFLLLKQDFKMYMDQELKGAGRWREHLILFGEMLSYFYMEGHYDNSENTFLIMKENHPGILFS